MNNNENLNSVNELESQNINHQQAETIEEPQQNNLQQIQVQSELQNIPNVEQDKQDFINNVESMHTEKKEEKKEGINFGFIIVMFAIILAAIVFLFPILLNYM